MKREEYNLLVESWRSFLNNEVSDSKGVMTESQFVFPREKQIDDMWHERGRHSKKNVSPYDLDRADRHGKSGLFREEMGLDDYQAHSIATVYYDNPEASQFELTDFPEEAHDFLNHYFSLDIGNSISAEVLEDLVVNKLGYDSEYSI
jgi:hypothetical protein